MIRSLLWKEWREHRWKMLALLGVFKHGIGGGSP